MPDIDTLLRRYLRAQVLAGTAYHVPDSEGLIKLDAMENPYTLPAELRRAWLEALAEVDLNRYPDPQARALSVALRARLGLSADTGLLLGNGSDELIQLLSIAFAGSGKPALAPAPSFVMYKVLAEAVGLDFIGVPLGADFALDRDAMLDAIARHEPGLIYLAYPNNPTGNLFDDETMHAILRAAPGVVVIDEAYSAFSSKSFLPILSRYDNLLLMRTLSKQGLAGLRLGLLMGAPAWIEQLDKLRLPYNINSLTQVSAVCLLRHQDVLDAQVRAILEERDRLFRALTRLPGVMAYPSEANFISFRVGAGRGDALFQALREDGILIKNLGANTALSDCLRVTVGTPEENAAFLQVLEKHL